MSEPTDPTSIIRGEQSATVTPPSVVLRVVSGPDTGKQAQVAIERVSVGTHASCGLVLSDRSVSKFHFDIGFGPGGLVLTDLGSTNGTFVAGLRVREVVLDAGAVIAAGRTTLAVVAPDKAVAVSVLPDDHLGNLVGASVLMRRLFATIARVAPFDVPVLVQGETGTGKEEVARGIHAQSNRRDKPFVVVDCGAIPAELAESELFGHTKGAFSGATTERRGAFETADGGTLFLDEIGDLDIELQPRLLRAVETKQVKRVGSDQYRSVNVRIVAATHHDLRIAVNEGSFREDLYYRLAVTALFVPALRERREDIPILVAHFLRDATETFGLESEPPTIAADVVTRLASLPWHGNCRELRNAVDRLIVMGAEETSTVFESAAGPLRAKDGDDVSRAGGGGGDESDSSSFARIPIRGDLQYREARSSWLDAFEREYLRTRVKMADGNVARTAREIGIDRAYLIRMMKRHGL